MLSRCLLTSVDDARRNYMIEVADTPALLAEAFRVRHQVYCVERSFESGLDGMETDGFDGHARHVLLRSRATGDVLGTVRVVLPAPKGVDRGMPLQEVCGNAILDGLPVGSMGEISRFALSKDRRAGTGEAGVFMRLGLMQGILRVSREAGLTHWCAIMERSLLRLLQVTAIHFQPVGPLVEHHGIRQPAYACIDSVLGRMEEEATPVWSYVTMDGLLRQPRVDLRLAA